MKIEKFQDIQAWQEARKLTKVVYVLSNQGKFSRDYGLRDQIQRASTSIMANISEGFDSLSKNEFVRFLTFARRSASEVQSHLYVAFDQNYISNAEFEETFKQAIYTKNLVGGFIRYLVVKQVKPEHRSTVTQ